MAATVIETTGLGRRFGRRTALADVTVSVLTGQVFGIVGPDGAGKTTLLQMLAGILRPSEGVCRVLGEDVRRNADRVQAKVGYMSQGFSLYDRLTVAENIAFAGRIRDVPDDAFEARKQELLGLNGSRRVVRAPCQGACARSSRSAQTSSTNHPCSFSTSPA